MIKITIATPAYGETFFTPYVSSMFKLTRHCQNQGWDFAFNAISYSEISESRNFLLTRWFDKSNSSHILFVDADMGFPAELISEMIAIDQPVVGVVYPKRAIDIKKVAEFAHAGDDPSRAINKAQDFVLRPLRGGGSEQAGSSRLHRSRRLRLGHSPDPACLHRADAQGNAAGLRR